MIYKTNSMYEKALALIEQLIVDFGGERGSYNGEPNTMLFLLRHKYQVQVQLS